MCGPAAIPLIMIMATVASTAAAAYSSYQQQKSANAANQYNAALQNRNAEIANASADRITEQGKVAEKQQLLLTSEQIGNNRASMGGSGLLVDSGSNLASTQDIAGFGALDAATKRNNYELDAWSTRNQASGFSADASLLASRQSSPAAAMAPSILSGASQLGGQMSTNYGNTGNVVGYRPNSIKAQAVY